LFIFKKRAEHILHSLRRRLRHLQGLEWSIKGTVMLVRPHTTNSATCFNDITSFGDLSEQAVEFPPRKVNLASGETALKEKEVHFSGETTKRHPLNYSILMDPTSILRHHSQHQQPVSPIHHDSITTSSTPAGCHNNSTSFHLLLLGGTSRKFHLANFGASRQHKNGNKNWQAAAVTERTDRTNQSNSFQTEKQLCTCLET